MSLGTVRDNSMVTNNPVRYEARPFHACVNHNEDDKDTCHGVRRLVSKDQYIKNMEKINKELIGPETHLEFSIHECTHEIMVKVVDDETKEVIKEIPPEKLLDLVATIWQIVGLFVDKYI